MCGHFVVDADERGRRVCQMCGSVLVPEIGYDV